MIDVATAYRMYWPIVLRKAQRMLGDTADAQDVAQESFVRLWRSGEALRAPERAVGWLYTTSTRLAVDRLRARRDTVDVDVPSPEGQAPDRVAGARHALARLARALDANEVELLVLVHVDGLEQREVAELLGLSERTVRRRVADLERRLGELGAGDV